MYSPAKLDSLMAGCTVSRIGARAGSCQPAPVPARLWGRQVWQIQHQSTQLSVSILLEPLPCAFVQNFFVSISDWMLGNVPPNCCILLLGAVRDGFLNSWRGGLQLACKLNRRGCHRNSRLGKYRSIMSQKATTATIYMGSQEVEPGKLRTMMGSFACCWLISILT